MALTPAFGGQQAWMNRTSYKTERKGREWVIKWKADTVKQSSNRNTEGRQRITKTSYPPSSTHTHTHSSACQTPDIYIRRGRTQWACGGIEGWGGEVGHAIGGCKHCKTVSPWKPAHCSEASHSPSIQSTAPPSLSKAKYPDQRAPESAPRLACQPGCPAQQMCTEEWPWMTGSPGLYRGGGGGKMRTVALTEGLCDQGLVFVEISYLL